MSESADIVPEQPGESAPTLERIEGNVPAAETSRGRYVRFFASVVVIAFGIAVAWLAVTLISSVHHG